MVEDKTREDKRIINCAKNLLSYLETTQKRSLSHLRKIIVVNENSFLRMDINTKRNLELIENIRTINKVVETKDNKYK